MKEYKEALDQALAASKRGEQKIFTHSLLLGFGYHISVSDEYSARVVTGSGVWSSREKAHAAATNHITHYA